MTAINFSTQPCSTKIFWNSSRNYRTKKHLIQYVKMLNLSMLKLIEHLTAKSKGLRWGTEYWFVIFTSPLKPIIIYPGGGAVEDHMTFRGKGGESTVAHNCHGKTKSHGTTNFTHGKTKFIHGKTKKTSWSAVVISIWNGMSCNSNTPLARKTAIFRARDVLLRVWIGSRWRCKLL